MRINNHLQPSFIHRNTIYTDGGGSYKHMFEKVEGVVDAQSQCKSDYAARCLFFFQLAENQFWKAMFFFSTSFWLASSFLQHHFQNDWMLIGQAICGGGCLTNQEPGREGDIAWVQFLQRRFSNLKMWESFFCEKIKARIVQITMHGKDLEQRGKVSIVWCRQRKSWRSCQLGNYD